MVTSMVEPQRATTVAVSEDTLTVELIDGRTISAPLVWYPRLADATPEERNNGRVIADGRHLHWPEVDEDISVEGLLSGRRSNELRESLERWRAGRRTGSGLDPCQHGAENTGTVGGQSGVKCVMAKLGSLWQTSWVQVIAAILAMALALLIVLLGGLSWGAISGGSAGGMAGIILTERPSQWRGVTIGLVIVLVAAIGIYAVVYFYTASQGHEHVHCKAVFSVLSSALAGVALSALLKRFLLRNSTIIPSSADTH